MRFRQICLAVFGGTVVVSAQYASAQEPALKTETFGSWNYRCSQTVTPPEDGADDASEKSAIDKSGTDKSGTAETGTKKICETNQVLQDGNGNVIAQIAFGISPVSPDRMVAAFQVPQGTLLSAPVRFGIEGQPTAIEAQYVTCYQTVCLARAEIDKKALEKFGSDKNGTLEFADRSGRKINVLLSLDGLLKANQRLMSGN